MSTLNNTLRGERGLMRPQVLVIFGLLALAMFAFQLRDASIAYGATIYSTGFDAASNLDNFDTFDNWDDGDNDGTNAVITTSGPDVSGRHLRLRGGEDATRAISTAGFSNIVITFSCAANSANDGNDELHLLLDTGSGFVDTQQWETNSGNAAAGNCESDENYSQKTVNVSAAGNNNADFALRFLKDGDNDEEIYIENLSVSGDQSAANNPPPVPANLAPANGASTSDTTPTFTWNASVDPDGDDVTYTIQGNGGSCSFGGTLEISATGLASPTFTQPGGSPLNVGTTYCWRVQAVDEHGLASGFTSTPFNLTISDVQAAPNPSLGESCGFDMVLVIDTSTSIDGNSSSGELNLMQSAFQAFVNAFLPGTPTQIAVVSFDDGPAVVQSGFSSNAGALVAAIEGTDGSGFTNWEAALNTAHSQFTLGILANDRPDIIVFSSDGNPTTSDTVGGTDTNQPNAHLSPAIVAANDAKADGIHIQAIGIGDELSVARLEAISETGGVITSDFAGLAADLSALAEQLCGGTITVQKTLDANGDLNSNPGGDRTDGVGWSFSATPANIVTPDNNVTDSEGQANFDITIDGDTEVVTVTETPQAGYALLSVVCTGADSFTPNLAGNSVQVTLGKQDIVNCEFINSPVPTLTLVKSLPNNNGGTAVASNWTLTADQVNGNGLLSGAGGASGTVPAGSYDLSETGSVAGYTNGTTWVCTGTGTQNDSDTITLANGQSATCTITNDDQPGTLVLRKVVQNNNGGSANAGQWTLTAAGPTPVSSNGQTDDDADLLEAEYDFQVNAGSYALSESGGPTGYTVGNWACTINGQDVAGANDNPVQVGNGQAVVCAIVNDDQPANLIVRKAVAGVAGVDAQGWTLSVDGPDAFAFDSVPGNDSDADVLEAQYAVGSIDAGTYTLGESGGPSGFTASAWSCTNGVVANAQSQITLGNGVSTVCTITNTAQPANLTLVKNVIADNGGNNDPNQWTLTADQQNGDGLLSEQGGGSGEVPAGTYDLSESGPGAPAWSASAWSCEGQGIGWSAADPSVITLDPGESATCTITNNDQPGTLIVVKSLTNDDGGPLLDESDFSFRVNGGAPVAFEADGQNNLTVNAGTYSVTEVEDSRYNMSYQNCTDLAIANGGSATCTITNDDKPSLTLVKHVDNGDTGGTATAADFTLVADGASNDFSDTGLEAGRTYLLSGLNDTFALSESGPDGYSASAWSCVGGTQNGASVTVSDGNSAVCTITNTAIAPALWLVKEVTNDNGGSRTAAAWTLTATGPAAFTSAGQVDETNDSPDATASYDFIVPIGSYALGESGPTGYAPSNWVCTIDQQPVDGANDSPIQVGLGETVVCTITNDDQPSSLSLVKTVVNDQDGIATADNWTLTANGNSGVLVPDADPLVATYVFAGIPAGTYDLAEAGVGDVANGYSTTGWVCVQVTNQGEEPFASSDGASLQDLVVGNGQAVICRITNDDPDILPAITVSKQANVDSVPETGGEVTYTVTVTNTSTVAITLNSLVDNVFGDLDGNGDCAVPQAIAALGSYQCSFTELVEGQPGTHTNEICADATDAQANEASDCGDEDVEITDVLPDITVVKTALDTEAESDGEAIEFRVDVTNNTDEEFSITSMVDDKFGDILDGGNALIIATDCTAATIAALDTYTCTFTSEVAGTPDSTHTNVVTVTGGDDDENEDSDSDDAVVTLLEDPLTVEVDKSSPDVTTLSDDAVVKFVVVVTNTSDEPVRIVSLTDSVYGDITTVHGDIDSTSCDEGVVIAAGADYECSFRALVVFDSETHINTVSVVVEEIEGGDTASDSDSDTIRFSSPPPPSTEPTPTPTFEPAPAVLSSGPPVEEVLPARLPATGDGPLSGGFGWLLVLGLGAIGLGSMVFAVTRLRRDER